MVRCTELEACCVAAFVDQIHRLLPFFLSITPPGPFTDFVGSAWQPACFRCAAENVDGWALRRARFGMCPH